MPLSFLPGLERRVEPGCLGCTPSSSPCGCRLPAGRERQCRLSIAGRAGNLAGTVRAAPTAAGQDGTRMGPGWAAA